ncbi:hypothetical protein E4U56_000850 [Claviceps arundinis]|uniref:Uncharacterized protein n=1 Tax=Claviceps arundinis TaxID=1623583 RepID=A0A9P7SNY1_9HYPO|nr:hypothetical protein E4U56_000850 [Claviceps arundinis]
MSDELLNSKIQNLFWRRRCDWDPHDEIELYAKSRYQIQGVWHDPPVVEHDVPDSAPGKHYECYHAYSHGAATLALGSRSAGHYVGGQMGDLMRC